MTDRTTGYFPFPDPCLLGAGGTPTGKCRHGVEFICDEGINKDAPGRIGFETARSIAVDATVDYVQQILDDVRVAGDAEAIRALMAIGVPEGSILTLAGGLDKTPKDFVAPVDFDGPNRDLRHHDRQRQSRLGSSSVWGRGRRG